MRRSTARTSTVSSVVVALALLGSGPAAAGVTGVCSGVLNAPSHRGSVQENLLKAAAKKNADLIVKLRADKAALEDRAKTLQQGITDGRSAIAALEAEDVRLDEQIDVGTAELARLRTAEGTTTAAVAAAEKALADLGTEKEALAAQLLRAQADLEAAEAARAELRAQAAAVGEQIAAKRLGIAAAQAALAGLQGRHTRPRGASPTSRPRSTPPTGSWCL
jgi:chromosome segregation ATPase